MMCTIFSMMCFIFSMMYTIFSVMCTIFSMMCTDVASDVGVNLRNVKSCLNTSNNEIFTDKRGDLPCVNISKHACPVVK